MFSVKTECMKYIMAGMHHSSAYHKFISLSSKIHDIIENEDKSYYSYFIWSRTKIPVEFKMGFYGGKLVQIINAEKSSYG